MTLNTLSVGSSTTQCKMKMNAQVEAIGGKKSIIRMLVSRTHPQLANSLFIIIYVTLLCLYICVNCSLQTHTYLYIYYRQKDCLRWCYYTFSIQNLLSSSSFLHLRSGVRRSSLPRALSFPLFFFSFCLSLSRRMSMHTT